MSNVRFYRLDVLPNFDTNKKGIFVHVTEAMKNSDWTTTGGTIVKPSNLQMGNGKVLVEWLTDRHIESIASGLWFGGENGWELLSNDTNSGAINAAIDAKIATLDAGPYAQAEINTDTPAEGEPNSSTLTIKGIKEVDGLIGAANGSDNVDFDIAIDGVYNESTNKIATQSTVTNAIEALDVNTVQAVTFNTSADNGNTTLTFKGIKEVDGRIAQGDEQTPSTFTVGDAKLNIQIGSTTIENVFSANAQSNGAIKLNENVFKKDGDVISVITSTPVASDNKLVTEKDVASLNGAMHYKGPVSSLADFEKIINNTDSDSDAEEAGNVYIATGNFTHGDNVISTGDMIVFNGATNYNVIQSNITLGTGKGQVAANTEGLTDGNLVVATSTGIKTTGISATVLEETNNTRNLTYSTITGTGTVKGISITDSLKIMNRNFNESINIVSENDSIQITVEKDEQADKGVKLDLVWNTQLD